MAKRGRGMLLSQTLVTDNPASIGKSGCCRVHDDDVGEHSTMEFTVTRAAFWNQVDKVMPDFQERKQWLRNNGAGMDL